MQVDFYGTYRLITGNKTIKFDISAGDTLLDLLHAVAEKFPALHKEIFDERGALFPYIPLYINGRNPRLLEKGINTALVPTDVISLFSPISSGHINVEDANRLLPVHDSKVRKL
jgi:MoaD family protein